MNSFKVMVISRDSNKGNAVVERLQLQLGDNYEVFGVYRDYYANSTASDCGFIIGDGTCKTCDNDGVSYAIYFSSFALALKHKKTYIPIILASKWTFLISVAIIKVATWIKSPETSNCK